MPRRSLARWLAPLALVAAALALLVVLTTSSSDTPTQDSAAPITSSTATAPGKRRAPSTTTTARRSTTGPTNGATTYTVQPGDYLSTVAAKTGLSVERLRRLNPGLDANSMTVGQQIKLQP
jgi:LysM repeat protein